MKITASTQEGFVVCETVVTELFKSEIGQIHAKQLFDGIELEFTYFNKSTLYLNKLEKLFKTEYMQFGVGCILINGTFKNDALKTSVQIRIPLKTKE